MQTKVTKIAGYTVVEFGGEPDTLDDIITYDDLIQQDEDVAYHLFELASLAKE